MANKYSEGKIYKLVNTADGRIYVGSTIQTLEQRLAGHKTDFDRGTKSSRLHRAMAASGIDHFRIEIVERYPCTNEVDLRAREQYWIDQLNPELNSYTAPVPGRSRKDYAAANIVKIKNYQCNYRTTHYDQRVKHNAANRDKINKQQRERYHIKRNVKDVIESLIDNVVQMTN